MAELDYKQVELNRNITTTQNQNQTAMMVFNRKWSQVFMCEQSFVLVQRRYLQDLRSLIQQEEGSPKNYLDIFYVTYRTFRRENSQEPQAELYL